jgi:hypothetical protein
MWAEAENNLAHMTANSDPGFDIQSNDEGRTADSSFLLRKFRENHAWPSLRMVSGACVPEVTARSLFGFHVCFVFVPPQVSQLQISSPSVTRYKVGECC